jgi:hypothetical protein
VFIYVTSQIHVTYTYRHGSQDQGWANHGVQLALHKLQTKLRLFVGFAVLPAQTMRCIYGLPAFPEAHGVTNQKSVHI